MRPTDKATARGAHLDSAGQAAAGEELTAWSAASRLAAGTKEERSLALSKTARRVAVATALVPLIDVGVLAFQEGPATTDERIRFTDVTKRSGINFQQSYGDSLPFGVSALAPAVPLDSWSPRTVIWAEAERQA